MASKQTIRDQQTTLLAFLQAAPDALGIEAIAVRAGLGLDRRTLLRRLDALIKEGRLARLGQSSETRYRAAAGGLPEGAGGVAPPLTVDAVVTVSTAGARVRGAVSTPIGARPIVGYARGFLDRYRPNVTAYLTAAERRRLHTLGTPNMLAEGAGTFAKTVLILLQIDLSWTSSRLEGTTYSLLDTKRLVDFGHEAEGKDRREAQMILNHKSAIEFLVQSAGEVAFDRLTILNLHALLADGLLDDPDSPGRLRRILIGIAGSTYHPPAVPALIEECFDQLLATAAAIADPFEQALFVMAQMPYLQPFDDVNKRTSRLAANIPLIRGNLYPLSFVDVPKDTYTQAMLGVYELNDVALLKDVFLWAYERSAKRYTIVRQQIGDPDPFRLRHRAALREVVGHVIREALDRRDAFAFVAAWAAVHLDVADQAPFREMSEAELTGLHDGNFARYGVRPSQYQAWRAAWERPPVARRVAPKRTSQRRPKS